VNGYGYHIAYHYVIDGTGKIWDTRPLNEIGYHASNYLINQTSIGICLVGNFDSEKPNDVQIDSLRKLCKDLSKKYNISPQNIRGHRDYASKSCPGKNVPDSLLDDLLTPPPMNSTDITDDASKKLIGVVTKVGFVQQDTNACVPYSLMLNCIYRACVRDPELIGKLKPDPTFADRMRDLVGVQDKAPMRISQIKDAMIKNDKPIRIHCGEYDLELAPRGGITQIQAYYDNYKKYIRQGRPVIVSMTYSRYDEYGINIKEQEVNATRLGKHNANLIGVFAKEPHKEYIYSGSERILKRENQGLALWMDASSKNSYEGYAEGIKGMPVEFLKYHGNAATDGIAEAYVTNAKLIKV